MENEKQRFLKAMEELYDFTEKEFESCPWIKKLDVEEAITQLEGELDEIREELSKNRKEELAKETADALRDSILLLFIISKKTRISKDRMLRYIIKKVKWRKPWVEERGNVSIDEAIELWKERKLREDIDI